MIFRPYFTITPTPERVGRTDTTFLHVVAADRGDASFDPNFTVKMRPADQSVGRLAHLQLQPDSTWLELATGSLLTLPYSVIDTTLTVNERLAYITQISEEDFEEGKRMEIRAIRVDNEKKRGVGILTFGVLEVIFIRQDDMPFPEDGDEATMMVSKRPPDMNLEEQVDFESTFTGADADPDTFRPLQSLLR